MWTGIFAALALVWVVLIFLATGPLGLLVVTVALPLLYFCWVLLRALGWKAIPISLALLWVLGLLADMMKH